VLTNLPACRDRNLNQAIRNATMNPTVLCHPLSLDEQILMLPESLTGKSDGCPCGGIQETKSCSLLPWKEMFCPDMEPSRGGRWRIATLIAEWPTSTRSGIGMSIGLSVPYSERDAELEFRH